MNTCLKHLLDQLNQLSAAEEFFNHLDVAYAPGVLHVNRMHILMRFQQYLKRATAELGRLEEAAALKQACAALLARAHDDFVRSNAATEKVFKVFQEAEGGAVSLDTLRRTLPSRAREV